jgi:uncharacterized membrane protein YjjP (DUF1212 family)
MTPRDPRADFLVALAKALTTHGTTAHRIEEAVSACARTLGVPAQVFAVPTGVFLFLTIQGDHQTHLIRIESGSVNLERLALLDAVLCDVTEGRLSPQDATARIDAITAAPPRYGRALSIAAFCLTSAAVARLFGGGLNEVITSAVLGLLVGLTVVLGSSIPRAARILEFIPGLLAALVAMTAGEFFQPLSPPTVMLAGLIILLPGLSLTLAMNELASRNLVAGTARLMGATTTFLAIAFGVALGQKLGALAGLTATGAAQPLPEWTILLALAISPFPLTILFSASPRHLPLIIGGVFTAFYSARAGAYLVGPELGACLGAFVCGCAANLTSRFTNLPAAVPLLPSLLLLVPGSIGFQSLLSLMDNKTLVGVQAAVTMFVVVIALVVGLLLANAALPARRPL